MDELKFNLVPNIVRENSVRLYCMNIINFKYIIKMAKNVINEKGFKVIALTPNECFRVGFGYYSGVINELVCDNCNEIINNHNEVYYIPVLNRVFCKECFVNWYENAERYTEDARWETRKYNAFVSKAEHEGITLVEINYKDITHG